MQDPFDIVQDASWNKRSLLLAEQPVEVAIKRCEGLESARLLVDKYYRQIHSHGGTIITGNSSPIDPISAQEVEAMAKLGLAPRAQQPYWLEVIVFRRILFEQMLDYITLIDYGLGFRHTPGLVRSKAFGILSSANKIAPVCFKQVMSIMVGVQFLTKVPDDAFSEITERALTFNQTYFTMQVARHEWKRQFRRLNGFTLGPS